MARRRYQRKPRQHGEVELKMAAMLDMAFQLLAFFILTFRPSPMESQISLRMPPNQPVTQSSTTPQDTPPEEPLDTFSMLLSLQLHATEDGEIAKVVFANQTLSGEDRPALFASLDRLFSNLFAGGLYEGVSIQVGSELQYERLLQVIDLCSKQKLPSGEPVRKVSFTHLP